VLRGKQVTMHTLRHTAAMRLLHAGIDIAVIALWLGHEQITHQPARRREPEGASACVNQPGRYQPSDSLRASLDGL
jgi:integrase